MKRTISIILVATLLVACTFALAACGGGVTQEDWYNGINAYATADVITIKIDDNDFDTSKKLDRQRMISDCEIAFDANKGIAIVKYKVTQRAIVDLDPIKSNTTNYYVLDGSCVTVYQKSNEYGTWRDKPITKQFDSEDDAKTYLRNLYLHPTDIVEKEFPSFLELKYYNGNTTSTSNPRETKVDMFKTKFTQIHIDEEYKYTYELSFSNGKPSKFVYKHKAVSTGTTIDSRTYSVTIKYSAKVDLPDDLPQAK